MTSSHGADTAPLAATLRGWASGVPQVPGMWFTVELPQPALVTELQFESANAPNEGRGGGRGAGIAPPPPVNMYPRAYSVQLSMDGKSWSAPVAEGKGTPATTVATFRPAQARFIRVTQTDAGESAPPWSVLNFRVYTAGK